MKAILTNYGIAEISKALEADTSLEISRVLIGNNSSTEGATLDATQTSVKAQIVHTINRLNETNNILYFSRVSANQLKISIYLDATIGDFMVGQIGLLISKSQKPIILGLLDSRRKKIKTKLNTPGNTIKINFVVTTSADGTSPAVTLTTENILSTTIPIVDNKSDLSSTLDSNVLVAIKNISAGSHSVRDVYVNDSASYTSFKPSSDFFFDVSNFTATKYFKPTLVSDGDIIGVLNATKIRDTNGNLNYIQQANPVGTLVNLSKHTINEISSTFTWDKTFRSYYRNVIDNNRHLHVEFLGIIGSNKDKIHTAGTLFRINTNSYTSGRYYYLVPKTSGVGYSLRDTPTANNLLDYPIAQALDRKTLYLLPTGHDPTLRSRVKQWITEEAISSDDVKDLIPKILEKGGDKTSTSTAATPSLVQEIIRGSMPIFTGSRRPKSGILKIPVLDGRIILVQWTYINLRGDSWVSATWLTPFRTIYAQFASMVTADFEGGTPDMDNTRDNAGLIFDIPDLRTFSVYSDVGATKRKINAHVIGIGLALN